MFCFLQGQSIGHVGWVGTLFSVFLASNCAFCFSIFCFCGRDSETITHLVERLSESYDIFFQII